MDMVCFLGVEGSDNFYRTDPTAVIVPQSGTFNKISLSFRLTPPLIRIV